MSLFAVLDSNNMVINTIIADTKEIAETATGATCIEFNETNPTGFGYVWDGETFNITTEEIKQEENDGTLR